MEQKSVKVKEKVKDIVGFCYWFGLTEIFKTMGLMFLFGVLGIIAGMFIKGDL